MEAFCHDTGSVDDLIRTEAVLKDCDQLKPDVSPGEHDSVPQCLRCRGKVQDALRSERRKARKTSQPLPTPTAARKCIYYKHSDGQRICLDIDEKYKEARKKAGNLETPEQRVGIGGGQGDILNRTSIWHMRSLSQKCSACPAFGK